MTEIEKTEGEIKVLQAKLELLKEMENHKSPAEEAYKRVYNYSPPTSPYVSNFEDTRWRAFELGYRASQEDYKVGEYQPSPQTPEPYCPDDPPEYDEIEWDEKDNPKPKTLRSIINRWWMDTFTSKNKWSVDECIDDLADQIEFFYMRNKK